MSTPARRVPVTIVCAVAILSVLALARTVLINRQAHSAEEGADRAAAAPTTRERIEAALKQPASFKFKETPLADALAELSKSLGFAIELDLKALEDSSVNPRVPVTFDARQTSLGAALRRMLRSPISLWPVVKEDMLLITTPERADSEIIVHMYDVKDLVTLSDDSDAIDDLIEMITSIVAPASWEIDHSGGIVVYNSLFAIPQTADAHREIDELFAALRKVSGPQNRAEAQATAPVDIGDARAAHAIREKLDQPVSVEWKDVPLHDAIRELADRYKVPIELDEPSLEDVSFATGTPITRRISGVSLRSALRLLLGDLQLTTCVVDEALVVTTPETAELALVTRLYPVADLIPRGAAAEGGPPEDFESLIELVRRLCRPDSWNDAAGPGTIKSFPPAGVLVCSTTEAVHDDLERLLADLRTALAKQAESARRVPPAKKRPAALVTHVYVLFASTQGKPVADVDQLAKEVTQLVAKGQWSQDDVFVRGVAGRLVVRHTFQVQWEVQSLLREMDILVPTGRGGFAAGNGGRVDKPGSNKGGGFFNRQDAVGE